MAMVQGCTDSRRDGVADYCRQLAWALREQAVDVVQFEHDTARATTRAVRAMRADVVHVQWAPAAYGFSGRVGLLPLHLHQRPRIVTTLHEYGGQQWPAWVPPRLWEALERLNLWDRETGRLVPASDVVVVTNQAHAELLRSRSRTTCRVIPLAPTVSEAGDVPGAARPGPPTAVFFGFVHPGKGTRRLLEALPLARRDLRLRVVGGFTSLAMPERAAREHLRGLTRLAEDLGVADRVQFTGYLPAAEVSRLLHGADLAVLPLAHGVTTRSGALLSVLAHGLPTLVTAADPPDPELVDGSTVSVIPVRGDAAAIACTINGVLADDRLRARLSAGGREVAARHSWQRVARSHVELYEQILRR
ncbi:hypothetical protein GCM10010174_29380 [Kutzneria viridogrisea]|uniref:Glycosyltransferase involved in cell wall biosynthesis n=2 Tax=Kutzneria viridogrisea TaxID=47990 RepID=A0ABR6BCX2_9PSEU|nr:glycosyltransferase involved in cell wall biosynthesis [Kutzneria viridogrisea]